MDKGFWDIVLSIVSSKTFYIPVITICITILLIKLSSRIIKKMIVKDSKNLEDKRRNTIFALIENIIKYLFIIFAVLTILGAFGFDVSGIIAGLGVAGVVGGLALQDALKDIIMGVNIIMDNYFVVGDIVSFNNFTGEVIEFGLKNTKIKSVDGIVLIVANREIAQIKNLSQKSSTIVIKVPVAYEEKEEKVAKALNRVLDEVATWDDIKGRGEYLGIDSLDESSITYMINTSCTAGNQFVIRRKMLSLIKKEFDKSNIKIPYAQIEVHNGKNI